MCFGSSKDKHNEEQLAPRPALGKVAFESEPKAGVPSQYQHQQPDSQQPQQQRAVSPSNDYTPPPGPPPSQRPPVSSATADDYAPPPGPPPSHGAGPASDEYAPPPGPPPPSTAAAPSANDDYAPPPGPPPSHNDLSYTAPPPGPPPAHADPKPQPQHDWEILVPDTSLFPPPPSFFSGWDRSPANNATEAEAEAGEAWCRQHPLTPPITLDPAAAAALRAHNPRLMQPDGFQGSLFCTAPGVWEVRTTRKTPDSTIIAYPPLYTVTAHSPLNPSLCPGRVKTIYYEVELHPATRFPPASSPDGVVLAMGFAALPYPPFRLPGWHRGSLAVHGDDGHRFVNDRWGGKDFAQPFKRPGERLGVGMTFSVGAAGGGGGGHDAAGPVLETSVFFTRDGREVGRWDLHEEGDAELDLPVEGLEGYHDLSCAIGACGEVRFQVFLDPGRWAYRPVGY